MDNWGSLPSPFLFGNVDISLESFHCLCNWTSTSRSQFKCWESCLIYFWICLYSSMAYSVSQGNLGTKVSCKSSHLKNERKKLRYLWDLIFVSFQNVWRLLKNIFGPGISVWRYSGSCRLNSGWWESEARGHGLLTLCITKSTGTNHSDTWQEPRIQQDEPRFLCTSTLQV